MIPRLGRVKDLPACATQNSRLTLDTQGSRTASTRSKVRRKVQ